jgi:hypothetical protein
VKDWPAVIPAASGSMIIYAGDAEITLKEFDEPCMAPAFAVMTIPLDALVIVELNEADPDPNVTEPGFSVPVESHNVGVPPYEVTMLL